MPQRDFTFLNWGLPDMPKCRQPVDQVFTGHHELHYLERGRGELSYVGRRQLLDGGWLWTCYPGPRIRFRDLGGDAPWVHRYVAFRGPLVSHWISEGLFFLGAERAPAGPGFPTCFDRLVSLVKRRDRWGPLAALNALERILLDVAEARPRGRAQGAWLGRALRELSGSSAPDYLALARGLGMSVATLRRRFKAATGYSLHRHVVDQRLAAAAQLLADTDLPVKAVALKVGYRDVHFFTRQFRALGGIPPATYRRIRQQG